MIINNPINQDVSCFLSLGGETVKQTLNHCNNSRDISEIDALKTLADKVLARNKLGNKSETTANKPVSLNHTHETKQQDVSSDEIALSVAGEEHKNTSICTNIWNSMRDMFEERAAIYEFEANYPTEEAELWARKDVLMEFIINQYPQIMAEFENIISMQLLN